jgi:uncharacterized repeat protein (TIGR03803 family)
MVDIKGGKEMAKATNTHVMWIMGLAGLGTGCVSSAAGQTFVLLHTFTGGKDGANPQGTLVLNGGNLYGTAYDGALGYGTVFQVNIKTHKLTVLHAFAGPPSDGQFPLSGLVLDQGRNFYGTTYAGGALGLGTVYQVNSGGTESVVHSFAGSSDGCLPYSGLIRDSQGNLYGTTSCGGAPPGGGAVFKLDTTGQLTLLYSFGSDFPSGGFFPIGGLLLEKGELYGTTALGGDYGTVFKVNVQTGASAVLHNFTSGLDGSYPAAGLIGDSAGNLYGTTEYGGDGFGEISGYGVVFKLNIPTSLETILYTFNYTGGGPTAGLVRDSQGNLYGTTVYGTSYGNVFKLDTSGNLTVLHAFSEGADGEFPQAGLVMDSEGNLYGATSAGGKYGYGTIFAITP